MATTRPTSPPDLNLVDGLVQTSHLVQSILRELAVSMDASVLQVRVLGILRDRTPTMAELGRLMELDKSSTTGLVDRTVARGLIRRVADHADGRVVRVELTPDGRRLVEASSAAVATRIAGLTGHLDGDEREALTATMSSLVHRYAESRNIDLRAGAGGPGSAGASDATSASTADVGGARIAVVIGSTRPARICPAIATWVRDALAADSRLGYELVDLAGVALPMLDEPLMPALHTYAHPHTAAWSRLVESYHGFVFVFPQYNWGYPGVLKNALDFLYDEWKDKPASMVSYGTRGGSRAVAQLSQVLQGLDMRQLDQNLEVRITRQDVDAAWQLQDVDALMAPYRDGASTIDHQMTAALAATARPG